MSYVAQNLDEIADLFTERAVEAGKASNRMTSGQVAASLNGEAKAWHEAAYILRRTTLKEGAQ